MAIVREKKREKTKPGIMFGVSILLIEDQSYTAELIATMLTEKWSCQVDICSNQTQVQELLRTRAKNFFLAISDLHLPDAPNGEIIDLLHQHHVPTIAISGMFDEAMHDQLIKQNVIEYLLKDNPIIWEYLVNLVGRLYLNRSIHVLVVDDSISSQQYLGACLANQFLQVHYANDGVDGINALTRLPNIKMVLVDAEMPQMNGLTFVSEARKQRSKGELCIIGISASSKKNLSSQFLKHGANDFIAKPFSYDELSCRVNQNLNMLEYIEEIHRLAYSDFLTQIPNRRHFFEKGVEVFLSALIHKRHTVVGVIDIDHFKQINDHYGHASGDLVLKQLGEILNTQLKSHLFARLGGEEFGFILQCKNFTESEQLVEKLRTCVEHFSFNIEENTIQLTISIGVTYEMESNLDDTLRIADRHLYHAKQSGRNKVVWNHTQLNI